MGHLDSSGDLRRVGPPARRSAARPPRQTRGQERVNAILDAAAASIAEEGLAGVTMHALARRARTSIGSLYHFFPDRDSVLDALAERHRVALREISAGLAAVPTAVWQALSPAAAIERLVMPYIEYLQRHGDALPLMHDRPSPQDGTDFIRTIQRVLEVRLPGAAPGERSTYVAMLHAIGVGTVRMGFQADPRRSDVYLREIPRVMAAYLAEIEAAVRDASRSSV